MSIVPCVHFWNCCTQCFKSRSNSTLQATIVQYRVAASHNFHAMLWCNWDQPRESLLILVHVGLVIAVNLLATLQCVHAAEDRLHAMLCAMLHRVPPTLYSTRCLKQQQEGCSSHKLYCPVQDQFNCNTGICSVITRLYLRHHQINHYCNPRSHRQMNDRSIFTHQSDNLHRPIYTNHGTAALSLIPVDGKAPNEPISFRSLEQAFGRMTTVCQLQQRPLPKNKWAAALPRKQKFQAAAKVLSLNAINYPEILIHSNPFCIQISQPDQDRPQRGMWPWQHISKKWNFWETARLGLLLTTPIF